MGIPGPGTAHRPRRTEQGALHHSAPSLSQPQRLGIQEVLEILCQGKAFRELQSRVYRPLILVRELENSGLRVSCVLEPDRAEPQPIGFMVGASGIEPPTPTMSR